MRERERGERKFLLPHSSLSRSPLTAFSSFEFKVWLGTRSIWQKSASAGQRYNRRLMRWWNSKRSKAAVARKESNAASLKWPKSKTAAREDELDILSVILSHPSSTSFFFLCRFYVDHQRRPKMWHYFDRQLFHCFAAITDEPRLPALIIGNAFEKKNGLRVSFTWMIFSPVLFCLLTVLICPSNSVKQCSWCIQ